MLYKNIEARFHHSRTRVIAVAVRRYAPYIHSNYLSHSILNTGFTNRRWPMPNPTSSLEDPLCKPRRVQHRASKFAPSHHHSRQQAGRYHEQWDIMGRNWWWVWLTESFAQSTAPISFPAALSSTAFLCPDCCVVATSHRYTPPPELPLASQFPHGLAAKLT